MYKIPANTLFIGKHLIFVPECHSTNTLAYDLSQQPSTTDGTIIITDHQTAGRGQRGNTWEAEKGRNLTFSLILKPSFLSVKDQFFLNIFASLAIHDLLVDTTNATVSIKWPNDILINSKKLCGILIENQIRGSQVSNTIVGIGLNVNQTAFASSTATSIASVVGVELDLNNILEKLTEKLEARYLQLRQGIYAALKSEYLQKLYWRNEMRTFATGEHTFKGTITGIDEAGQLCIESERGLQAYGIKEIKYIQ